MKYGGWGNISLKPAQKWVINWSNHELISQMNRSLIPRGSGRAYGDAAYIENGILVSTEELTRILDLDLENRVCEVESGVTIVQLIEFLMPHRLFPPVVPGSRFITVGGCLASDIHGKNHRHKGTFGEHVKSFKILLPSGEIVEVDKEGQQEIFSSVAGGMGLTGVILSLKLQLDPLPSSSLETNLTSTKNLQETFIELNGLSLNSAFCIAWVDFANQRCFGRGIIYSSNFLHAKKMKIIKAPRLIRIPRISINVVSYQLIKYFNRFRYYSLKKKSTGKPLNQNLWNVFFPSDLFHNWNRLFGKKGLMEYQFQFPFDRTKEAEELLLLISSQVNPALCAIKVLGKENDSLLSFPRPGFLVGITFPWNPKLEELVHEWDAILLKMEGRKYLSKDQLTYASDLRKMYPNWEKFVAIKESIDQELRFQSDLYVRFLQS